MRARRLACGLRAGATMLVAGALVGGCVGRLETTPYRERTANLGEAIRGVSYSLPKLQYQIKLSRTLVECPGEVETETASDGTVTTKPRLVGGKPTTLKFAIEAVETPEYAPGEAYTVNYEQLPGFLRTGSFEIKYWPNGNLKSIGAGAEDKTADALKDVVKTGVSVASMVMGGPLSTPPDPGRAFASERILGCKSETLKNVQEARKLRETLKTRPKKLEQLTKEIERFQARAALRLKDPRDRDDLLALFKKIDDEQAAITADTERLAALTEKLGVSRTVSWDGRPENLDDSEWKKRLDLTGDERAKLAALLTEVDAPVAPAGEEAEVTRRNASSACFKPLLQAPNCVSQHLNLVAAVHRISHLPDCPEGGSGECISPVQPRLTDAPRYYNVPNPRFRDASDDKPDEGIFVREPVQARLLLCRSSLLTPAQGETAEKKCEPKFDDGKLKQATFPQLGQLRYLPLRVGTFQAREMALSVTEDGRIESFSYKSTKAPGAVAAAAFADATSQIDTALEKIETEKRDDRKYAFEHANDEIQAQINKLTLEAKERELLAPPSPANPLQPQMDALAALQLEVAILKLERQKNDLLKMGVASSGGD